ncbi:extracellular solute-binding protein [Brachyspira sp. SAP_772]|uniref:extracellular solute-binding protein n=1 Tax=Brachyspira sp. SAP_772 TaxID=2608385 RepID=UPI0012F51CB9|nr:extracellular solute-binding protein [Brachyspira sp. SAP_772]
MKKNILLMLLVLGNILSAEIFVYGPGGPAPVIKELAKQFEDKTGEKVTVIAGPTANWIDKAKQNADIIFSGSTSMMDGFIKMLPNRLRVEDIQVLNIRRAGIIVRPNNPKNIKTFNDILKPNINVMVVDGAGQVGLYEDMALLNADKSALTKLRKNIKFYAPSSAAAVEKWNSDKTIDALIIWSHWVYSIGLDKSQFVDLKSNVIYRSSEAAVTTTSKNKAKAQEFIKYITSKEAESVWKKYSWEIK